jgi:beta-phosphoglucomutase-like phosphatase (HAD superfamily)
MKFQAVLFDCDGVLVDSEAITNGVLRDMLEESGWSLTPAQCMAQFVGKAVLDERLLIESRTGRPLTEEWLPQRGTGGGAAADRQRRGFGRQNPCPVRRPHCLRLRR